MSRKCVSGTTIWENCRRIGKLRSWGLCLRWEKSARILENNWFRKKEKLLKLTQLKKMTSLIPSQMPTTKLCSMPLETSTNGCLWCSTMKSRLETLHKHPQKVTQCPSSWISVTWPNKRRKYRKKFVKKHCKRRKNTSRRRKSISDQINTQSHWPWTLFKLN